MIHLDLFSGIGGFAHAIDQVWDNVDHIFCDNNKFCQQILKKHWPESEIYDDIRQITIENWNPYDEPIDILTGGFPCQPFSQAGKRKGTDDNRHLWPEMLRVIRLTKPQWVIAENVSGLLTMQDGLVFEQICSELEASGYEVQSFIIPAVAVNAPHKRARVWICGYANSHKYTGRQGPANKAYSLPGEKRPPVQSSHFSRTSDAEDWLSVASRICGMDYGLPDRMDRIKSLGNAIVPQVAVEILKGIKLSHETANV